MIFSCRRKYHVSRCDKRVSVVTFPASFHYSCKPLKSMLYSTYGISHYCSLTKGISCSGTQSVTISNYNGRINVI